MYTLTKNSFLEPFLFLLWITNSNYAQEMQFGEPVLISLVGTQEMSVAQGERKWGKQRRTAGRCYERLACPPSSAEWCQAPWRLWIVKYRLRRKVTQSGFRGEWVLTAWSPWPVDPLKEVPSPIAGGPILGWRQDSQACDLSGSVARTGKAEGQERLARMWSPWGSSGSTNDTLSWPHQEVKSHQWSVTEPWQEAEERGESEGK
jgi:hypothetical protein